MPNSAVGLQTVFGTSVESTYGTPVTPDRWYGLVNETLERKQVVIQSQSIFAGSRNVRRGATRALTHRWGEGDVNLEVATKGFGRWFDHMLGGTVATTTPDAVNSPTVRLHTFQMGSLTGKSLTIQKGLRDQAGNTREKFTFHGSKVKTWGFGIAVGQILNINLGIDSEDVDDSTALAAHSYTSAGVFHFAQGTVKLGGASVGKVLAANVAGDNALKTDSFFLGTGGLKGEPEPNDFPSVTGSLNMEFDQNDTIHDLYAADTGVAFVLEFVGTTISDNETYLLRVTVPEIHFTGETPKVGGPAVVTLTAPFEAAYDGTNQSAKFEYQTTDTTI